MLTPRKIFSVLILMAIVGGGLYLLISGIQVSLYFQTTVDSILRGVFGGLMVLIGFPILYRSIPNV